MKKSIVFSIEALLSLLAAAAFLSCVNAGSTEASYRDLYAYQIVQDVLEVSSKSEGTYSSILEWRSGSALAESRLREKLESMTEALGNHCLRLKTGGKTIEAKCEAHGSGVAEATRVKLVKIRGERIFFDGKNFFTLEAELEV
jgi:hypothetical protein